MFLELVHISVRGEQKDLVKKRAILDLTVLQQITNCLQSDLSVFYVN